MMTVTSGSGSTQSYVLPSGTSGQVFVKVRDSHRAADLEPDLLQVDRLAIEIE